MLHADKGRPTKASPAATWAVWGALFSTTVLCTALAAAGIPRLGAEDRTEMPEELPWVLGGVALVSIGIAQFLWMRATGERSRTRSVPNETLKIATWALDESLGPLGLVLASLGYGFEVWLPFTAAGIVLFLLHRPEY